MKSQVKSAKVYSVLFLFFISTLSVFAQDRTATGATSVALSLNNQAAGDTSDPTLLIKRLRQVFKEREINGVFRPNTNEIEKRVLLDGVPDISVVDFIKSFVAAKAAGADPIQIAIVKPAGLNVKPNPLTLDIRVGKPQKDAFTVLPTDGIDIGFIGQLEPNGSVGTGSILISMDESGTYSIAGKSLPVSLLKPRLLALKPANKTVFVDASKAPRFGPVKDLVNIAANSGFTKVYLITPNTTIGLRDLSFSISPAWTKMESSEKDSVSFEGTDGAMITFDTRYMTDEDMLRSSIPGSPMSRGTASLTAKDLSDELDLELPTAQKFGNGVASRSEIDGAPGILSKDPAGSTRWFGFRLKNGKLQVINISASCSKAEYSHRKSEFDAILHSVKFESQ